MRNTMNLKAIMSGKIINERIALGDNVKVGAADETKREGVVKVPDAPSDTVGVLIDGELEMVPEKEVHPVAAKEAPEAVSEAEDEIEDEDEPDYLKEGVLGMIGMPSLTRMRELAGIRMNEDEEKELPDFMKKKDETEETETEEADESTVDDGEAEEEVEMVVAAEPTPSAEVTAAADQMVDAVESQPVSVAANHPATAGEVTMMSAPVEPEPMPVAEEDTSPDSPEQICLNAIAAIEGSLPEIPVKQFNDIRKRMETIMNSLLEGSNGRGRKL